MEGIPRELLETLASYQEFTNADIDFLLGQLQLQRTDERMKAIANFRKQIWNVAVQEGWRAAIEFKPGSTEPKE